MKTPEMGGGSPENIPKAEKKESTLISMEELMDRAATEGINTSKIHVITPRWVESAPLQQGVKSALVRCDLILRSDGSTVWLDGNMGMDSMYLTQEHMQGKANPDNLPWEEWAKSVTQLPEEEK